MIVEITPGLAVMVIVSIVLIILILRGDDNDSYIDRGSAFYLLILIAMWARYFLDV